MASLVRCALLLLALPASTQLVPSPPRVIHIGDSWSEYAAQSLTTFCAGATAVNRGVASSTAQEWAIGGACPAGGSHSCSMAAAFSNIYGTTYTHAVMTVGGNDFLDTAGCTMTAETIQSRVTSAINALRAAAPAGIKIILPAYCTPTQAVGDCRIEHFPALNAGIQAAAAAAGNDVEFVDAHAACGGGTTTYSPGTYPVSYTHLTLPTKA